MKPEAAPSCLEQKTPLPKFAVIPDPCSGCGSVIRDRFLLRVNERSWHERCLRCCACGLVLAGNSCFSRECRIYCRHDYLRLFPRRCSRCRGALGGSERIQKVLEFLFHQRCLRCCSCSRRLRSGDRFVLRHGRILCPREPEFPGNPARSEEEEEEDSRNSRDSRDFSGKDPKRSKRPRTVLSWQQRRAFRESFRISAKPCRKVRESLAAQTGLTVRVVQVWFQNQRAKMKKLARRQQQEQLGNSRGEIPEGRRGRDRDRDRDRDEEGSGIFQEPPGDAPGSTENSQRVNLGNGGIPGIPEPGNPLERLYPGIPGIPEFGNPLERLYPGIPGIPEPGNALEQLYPGIPGIPEFGNGLEPLYPRIPGIPEFGNPLERLYPGIPGIPEFGNPLEPLYPRIPGIPDPRNSLEWLYPGIPGIPEPGNPMERLFSMQSSYFTS